MGSVAEVHWVQDMTSRWVRILSAAGDRRTPLDEAVDQINSIIGTQQSKGELGRLKRGGGASAEATAATVLCRLVIAGVLVGDLVLDQLCALRGETRQQVLDQLAGGSLGQLQDQQLSALQAQLSQGSPLLGDSEQASYGGLGARVEQLFRLAEEQAAAIVDAARREAAQIISAAGAQQPCPKCGAR